MQLTLSDTYTVQQIVDGTIVKTIKNTIVEGKIADEFLLLSILGSDLLLPIDEKREKLSLDDVLHLDITGHPSLTTLDNLPPNVQRLNLRDCPNLNKLELPEWLERFSLSGSHSLKDLVFPITLHTLKLINLPDFKALTALPSNLQNLNLQDCNISTELPPLPSGLKTLYMKNYSGLTNLQALPDGLQYLYLDRLPDLETLQNKLPSKLQTIHLSDCAILKIIPQLPNNLQNLTVSNCAHLEDIGILPKSLQRLHLSQCAAITNPPTLPDGLQSLVLSGFPDLKALQNPLPSQLKSLKISDCALLGELADLPEGLESLDLNNCNELKNLPKLPSTLKSLTLKDCASLEELPELPKGLRNLDLSNCNEIKKTPKLINRLEELQSSGCTVELPSNLCRGSQYSGYSLQNTPISRVQTHEVTATYPNEELKNQLNNSSEGEVSIKAIIAHRKQAQNAFKNNGGFQARNTKFLLQQSNHSHTSIGPS